MRDRTCPKCGKNFIKAAEHLYRVGTTYYCSWTCYLHRNDQYTAKKDEASTNDRKFAN